MTEHFLVRYHSSSTDLANYEFIYQISHDWTITKVIYQSLAYQCCNHDTVCNLKLEGSKVQTILFGCNDEPDLVTLKGNPEFKMYRCHKEAQITFMSIDELMPAIKKRIQDDPLLNLFNIYNGPPQVSKLM
jgi:hypothetical protein